MTGADSDRYEAKLLDPLPAGVHFRPYPGAINSLVMLWEFAHLHIENGRVPQEQPEFLDYLYVIPPAYIHTPALSLTHTRIGVRTPPLSEMKGIDVP